MIGRKLLGKELVIRLVKSLNLAVVEYVSHGRGCGFESLQVLGFLLSPVPSGVHP